MFIIAFISQKGGVGKSTLARALATALAQKNKVKIADCDNRQGTIIDWQRTRLTANYSPAISVESFANGQLAITQTQGFDYLIIDTPARTSKDTLFLAQQVDLLIQPTAPSLDDLRPAIREFNGLVNAGIKKNKLCFLLNHVATLAEVSATQEYLQEAGYKIFNNYLLARASYRQAQNEGKSIGEVSYKKLAQQTQKLINEIIIMLTLKVNHSQGSKPKG